MITRKISTTCAECGAKGTVTTENSSIVHKTILCRKCKEKAKPPPHPVQPLVVDSDNTLRFKQNKIVRFLLDAGSFNLNQLDKMPFENEDWAQLLQLIGMSLTGYGESRYVSDEDYDRAAAQVGEEVEVIDAT
jgi:hypothetical protein